LAALADRYDRIREFDTEIWALSVDSPDELAELRRQEELPFELLSDEDQSLIREWGILNETERGGIAIPNVYVVNQDGEIILHSRDTTSSRADPEPLVQYLKQYAEDPSYRKEMTDAQRKFPWPDISSLLWGLPRKWGRMTS